MYVLRTERKIKEWREFVGVFGRLKKRIFKSQNGRTRLDMFTMEQALTRAGFSKKSKDLKVKKDQEKEIKTLDEDREASVSSTDVDNGEYISEES